MQLDVLCNLMGKSESSRCEHPKRPTAAGRNGRMKTGGVVRSCATIPRPRPILRANNNILVR